jgi:hypothetical protein
LRIQTFNTDDPSSVVVLDLHFKEKRPVPRGSRAFESRRGLSSRDKPFGAQAAM